MRFGERGRGMWTAAIAEADKQTTQRGEAIFHQGHPFRRARVLRHASAARGRVSFPSSPRLVLMGARLYHPPR